MAKSSVLLGCVAFGVSGFLTLVGSRNWQRAFWAGATAVPAVLIAQGVARQQRQGGVEDRALELQTHIQALQQRRQEAYQEFVEIQAEKQRIALSLTSMHGQLRQSQLSGSGAPRRTPSWDLSTPAERPSPAHEQPTKMLDLPQPGLAATMLNPPVPSSAAASSPGLQPTTLNPPDPRASNSPRVATPQRYAPAGVHSQLTRELQQLQTQQQQLRDEITAQQQLRDRLLAEIPTLQTQQQTLQAQVEQLTAQVEHLKTQVTNLEAQQRSLTQQIATLQAQQASVEAESRPLTSSIQTLQSQLRGLQAERVAVETELGDRRHEQTQLTVELAQLQQELQTTQQALEAARNQPDAWGLTPPWRELMENLAKHEVEVLRVVATEANPNPQLKRIAEAQVTMPELLLDGINERALDTVGDLILEATGNGAKVAEEYQEFVTNLLRSWHSKHGPANQEVLVESV